MSRWINPHTGRTYGEVYKCDEFTVEYFERPEGDFVKVGGPGHPSCRMWTERRGRVFSRTEWDRMLEAATGRPRWLDEALNSGDGSYQP